jgi:hypothetical protein
MAGMPERSINPDIVNNGLFGRLISGLFLACQLSE